MVIRALAVVAALASSAAAEHRIVLMSDPGLRDAMQVQLAGRGVEVAQLPSPDGALRLDRAAVVQRAALSSHADAGIWIERENGAEVCVVSSDGRATRYAPLPDASPRVFAAIATSLLDEVLAPDATFHVDVNVAVNGLPPVAATPATIAPPGAVAVAGPELRPLAARSLVEIGPALSPATIGVEAELAMAVTPSVRFGVIGSMHRLYDGIGDMEVGDHFAAAGAELRYVGPGAHHFDVGAMGGIGTDAPPGNFTGDSGAIVGARLQYVWETRVTGIELAVTPTLLLGFRGHDNIPGVFTSVRWYLPL
jgi:hypothetical protein